jgi:hypothetical protein
VTTDPTTTTVRVRRRSLPALVALALLLTACTSDGESTSDSGITTNTTADTTTTTMAPIVRGLGEDLGLEPGQCYAGPPETTTTTAPTTTVPPSTDVADGVSTTEPPPPATTEPPPVTSTIPRPPLVAIVNCEGTHEGVVFATFCIGSLVTADQIIDLPTELGEVECPGDPELVWPGDRLLRRAAARECVARFDEVFDEPYALSEIGTTEFVPSRGVWERGDRRIVCTADQI